MLLKNHLPNTREHGLWGGRNGKRPQEAAAALRPTPRRTPCEQTGCGLSQLCARSSGEISPAVRSRASLHFRCPLTFHRTPPLFPSSAANCGVAELCLAFPLAPLSQPQQLASLQTSPPGRVCSPSRHSPCFSLHTSFPLSSPNASPRTADSSSCPGAG